MGTKLDCLPGFCSMRDLNEDSSSSSWPLNYRDKTVVNGQYYNGFMPRSPMDGYPCCGKDVLKHKMLEHEAVFKNQVCELHRLYRIQRDMMKDFRGIELHRGSMEPSSSSSLKGPQVPSHEARKWHMAGFHLLNSTYERTSISGVEMTNSPNQFPFQNGSSVKDSELLDSRPLKVRKKLFDLELPADECIDTEEGKISPEFKASHLSSYAPNVNLKSGQNKKLSPVRHTRATADRRVDVSTSASCLRNPIWLTDLNEPIDVEDTSAPSSTDFLGPSSIGGHTNGVKHHTESNAGFFGLNSKAGNYKDGFSINSSVVSHINDRGPLSHIYEAGSSKSNFDSVNPGFQQDSSPPFQRILHPHYHPPGIYPIQHTGEDIRGEGNHHHLESSNRSLDQSSNRFSGPHISSHAPGSKPFFNSSYFSGTWTHADSAWAKQTESFTQKISSLDSCLNPTAAIDRRPHISAECRESYGGKWCASDDFRFNHGSASRSKEVKIEPPLASFDYFNRNRVDKLVSDGTTNHGSGHFGKGSSFVADSKPAMDIDLNEKVSESSSNEVVILKNVSTVDEKGKPTDHLSTLPWLKNKPANANGTANSSQLCCKTETVGDLNEPFTPKVTSAENSRNQSVKKILGFPIFETGDPKNEDSSHVSTSASFSCTTDRNRANQKMKNIVIDINLECEPEEQIDVEKEKQAKCASARDFIDLNSCVTDCEDTSAPSYESKTENVKVILDINLESPVLPEEDENTAGALGSSLSSENRSDPSQHEALKTAAEAMVAISSSCPEIHTVDKDIDLLETSLAEPFLWFVSVVSSNPNELKSASSSEAVSPKDSSEEMDDFEAMTLQIPETKEEDYTPTQFVPDIQKAEATSTRAPRRGQSRRGRPRKDFQRDILPGLTSLSRVEVAEDIQTFEGLMRGTGHEWVPGVGRRNGGGRGRRRGVSAGSLTSEVEIGLEERRVTGWGKTTRRPRRQRCNPPPPPPPAVVMT